MTDYADLPDTVRAFVRASISGYEDRVTRLLATDPALPGRHPWAAVVVGDAAGVRAALAREPGFATRPEHTMGWTPLLVACNSRWHRFDPSPARSQGLCDVAAALLDAGADPDTSVGAPAEPGHCSALYGAAGLADHPALAELLLSRGADPDAPAALYHTVFHRGHESLRLLLAHGARAEAPDALAAAITVDDAEAVRLLLDAGVDPAAPLPPEALGESYAPEPGVGAAHAAVEFQASLDLLALLLERGALPDGTGQDGLTAHRLAVRQGRTEAVDLLRAHGAADDATAVDRFLGACVRGDRAAAEGLAAAHPGLVAGLTVEDHRAIAHAADHGDVAAVGLMLDLGFPLDGPVGDDGATPLHAAAVAGAADVVAFLVERGADVDATDTSFGASALCWAAVGSGFGIGHAPGADRVATVRVLLAAGASTDGVWVADKPPSAEVAAVLEAHGVPRPEDAG